MRARTVVALFTLVPFLSFLLPRPSSTRWSGREGRRPGKVRAGARKRPLSLPRGFLENRGQWGFPARYAARLASMDLFLERKAWVLALEKRCSGKVRGVGLKFTFPGACPEPGLVPGGPLPGLHHFFLGKDPSSWVRNVPWFRSVLYRGLFPGVDLRVRVKEEGWEYDLLLAPGASLSEVAVRVRGARGLRLDGDGTLAIETGLGEIRQAPPRAWEVCGSGKKHLSCRFRLLDKMTFGFSCPGRDRRLALVLDPLVFSTFLGGTNVEQAFDLALDSSGRTTLVGQTSSINYPVKIGSYDITHNGWNDAFVTRLSVDGSSLVFSTYLGGSSWDFAVACAVDGAGRVTLAGETNSPNFPTTAGAFDRTYNGGSSAGDAFVTRLSADGSSLVFSTYLGGSGDEWPKDMALSGQGLTVVVGQTSSSNFPVTPGAFATSRYGVTDAFVTKLNANGRNLSFSTYLGGKYGDHAYGVTMDRNGLVWVTGETQSYDFPTTAGAFDTTFNGGGTDAFVTAFNATGSALRTSTFLGGSGMDRGVALSLDERGAPVVTGWTRSTDFPVTSPVWCNHFQGGLDDVFVTRFQPTLSTLVFSTYLGGSGSDEARDLFLDKWGWILLTGRTDSPNFPTTPGAFNRTLKGSGDAFVCRLAPCGRCFSYASYLGGTLNDGGEGLACHRVYRVTVAGSTGSSDFPATPGAFDPSYNGNFDAFATRLNTLCLDCFRFGFPSWLPCCAPVVHTGGEARAGSSSFELACSGAPRRGLGVLFLSLKGIPRGMKVKGLTLRLDPSPGTALGVPVRADKKGECVLPLPLPKSTKGARIFAQFVWLGKGLTLAATSGLSLGIR